jgi:hypothetical protein
MVSRDNLASLRAASVPIGRRMAALGRLETAAGKVFRVYLDALEGGDLTLGPEELALTGFLVHASALGWELADDFTLDLDPADGAYVTRMEGLDRVRKGTGDIVSGALAMQTEAPTAHHGAPFWTDVAEDWAALVHRLGPVPQRDALARLDALVRGAPDAATAKALLGARAAVLGLPRVDVRLGGRDAAPSVPTAAGGRTVHVEVEPGVPFARVGALLGALGRAGTSKIALRLPGDARRVRLLRGAAASSGSDVVALFASKGIAIKTRAGNVSPGCAGYGPGVAVPNRTGGKRDFDSLAACAAALKLAAPHARSVTVVPSADTPFSDVMAAAGALGGPALDLFPDLRLGPR